MKIKQTMPPNYGKIVKAFPDVVRTPGVMFCYGDTIYAPHADVTPALVMHESVHSERQQETGGPDKWWDRYIEEIEFRLEEELLAHVAELHAYSVHGNRDERRRSLALLAQRLSSPLYGKMVTKAQAKNLLKQPPYDAKVWLEEFMQPTGG